MNHCQKSLVKVRDSMLPLAMKELWASREGMSQTQIELHEALELELKHFEKSVNALTSRAPTARITKNEVRGVLTSVTTLKSTISALQGKPQPKPKPAYRPQMSGHYNDFHMDFQIG